MFDKSQLLHALLQFMFGMLGALLVQLVFYQFTQKVVTVDITSMVKSFEKEALNQKLSSVELAQRVNKFAEALNTTLEDYSSSNHYILVPREVVISGALDKSSDIREMIKKRLNS